MLLNLSKYHFSSFNRFQTHKILLDIKSFYLPIEGIFFNVSSESKTYWVHNTFMVRYCILVQAWIFNTLALASRAASASAAIARWSWTGNRTSFLWNLDDNVRTFFMQQRFLIFSHISTLSTLTPQGSVASSSVCSMTWLMVSLSDKISAKCFVPKTFLRVVAANKWVECLKSDMQ